MHKDEVAKKTISILPLKEPGEPAVVSIPISQAKSALSITLKHPVINFVFNFIAVPFWASTLYLKLPHLNKVVLKWVRGKYD